MGLKIIYMEIFIYGYVENIYAKKLIIYFSAIQKFI